MYQWHKGVKTWQIGKTLYLSVPFTWLLPEAEWIGKEHKGPVVAGGPAVELMPDALPAEWGRRQGLVVPLRMHNPLATRTSEGCPNACAFCINRTRDLREIRDFEPLPVVCDDNFLACSVDHQKRAIERLRHLGAVDFNQGLQAGRFTADAIRRLQSLRLWRVRFAWDDVRSESIVIRAIERAKAAGLRNIRCYVLVGFGDTPADAKYRCETLRNLGVLPNPMRYQPLDCLEKNTFVGRGWTNATLQRFCRYWATFTYHGGKIPLEEFDAERIARSAARLAAVREQGRLET